MRLLTHNFLQSNVRGTTEGYPLKIEATKLIVESSSMDSVLVTKMLEKVNYPALVAAIEDVRKTPDLDTDTAVLLAKAPPIPSEAPAGDMEEATLKALHFFLFDVHILDGILQCPDTKRKFPIKNGIPNMILHEDEV